MCKTVCRSKRAEQWKTGLSGGGTLCYPDEQKRPMPSLRLVNLRDGLEDWALIEMLNPRTSIKECPFIQMVSKILSDFTIDPGIVLEARRKVVHALLLAPKN